MDAGSSGRGSGRWRRGTPSSGGGGASAGGGATAFQLLEDISVLKFRGAGDAAAIPAAAEDGPGSSLDGVSWGGLG